MPRTALSPVILGAALVSALLLAGCAAPAPTAPEASSLFDDSDLTAGDDASEAPVQTTAPEEPVVDLSQIDACALLPKPEAEAMAQVVFMDPTSTRDADSSTCQYDTDPYGDQPTGQAVLSFGDGAKKFYDIDVELGHAFEDVPGVGDEAHIEDNAIFVRSGALWFSLTIVRLDDAALFKQGIIGQAGAVAGRL